MSMYADTADRRMRARLAAAAERLLAVLDALDEAEEDLEDDDPAEEGGDLEPSLGSTDGRNQEKTWGAFNRAQSWHGEDLEFDGDTVADPDLEDGHDREDDPAEGGVGDADGMAEQFVGEPSLGATEALDQRVAWAQTSGLTDGEAAKGEVEAQLRRLTEEQVEALFASLLPKGDV